MPLLNGAASLGGRLGETSCENPQLSYYQIEKKNTSVSRAAARRATLCTMVRVGDRAPDFTAKLTTGNVFRLSEQRGRNLVLYFFPKAFTPG